MNYKKNRNRENMNIHIDLQDAKIKLEKDNKIICAKNFRKYDQLTDTTDEMFSKKHIKSIKKQIYDEFERRHTFIKKSVYLQKKIKRRINKNIDTSIYQILLENDNKNSDKTKMHIDYIEAMLKNVKRRYKETTRDYKKREKEFRKNYLKRNNINIKYDVKLPLLLRDHNIFDYFHVLKNAFRMSKFSDMSIYNHSLNNNLTSKKIKDKKIKRHFKNVINKANLKYTAKKENLNKKMNEIHSKHIENKRQKEMKQIENKRQKGMKQIENKRQKEIKQMESKIQKEIKQIENKKQKEKNKEARKRIIKGICNKANLKYKASKGTIKEMHKKAKKSIKKVLIVAGAVTAVATIVGDGVQYNSQNASANNYKEAKAEVLAENPHSNMKKYVASNLGMIIEDNLDKVIIEQQDYQKEQNDKQSEQVAETKENEEVEPIVLKDALIDSLEIDFNSEFSISEGKYYSSPNGTGSFGNYENVEGALKFNMVDVIDQNGQYHTYTIEDGKDLSEIEKMNPNASISYHIVSKENILGWNQSSENDIENNIVKGSIAKLKPYLSTETMKFLCDTELDAVINKNENKKYLDEIHDAMEKYKEDKVEEKNDNSLEER